MSSLALALTSSGIAATLTEGDRTVHFAPQLPLNLIQEQLCKISKAYGQVELLKRAKIIRTNAQWQSLEAMDRITYETTLKLWEEGDITLRRFSKNNSSYSQYQQTRLSHD
ncbi:hypothetical protein EVAR_102203_1 [Eumeta japonica]|uniref:ATP-dependent DNA helicase n=1 Tax=Eumeta variegata TaxID=151549 RepID=A0A4C1WEF9_EUMVA|nr:hypothetical protein EVAR_102203_1 [Eumeta japonica]